MENTIALAAGLFAFAAFYGIAALVSSYRKAAERLEAEQLARELAPRRDAGRFIGSQDKPGVN